MTVLDEYGKPMRWPRVPWSYSALSKFEECELNYGEINVRKNYPFETSDAMNMGTEVHLALEKYISAGTELPHALKHMGHKIDALCSGSLEVYAERDINLTFDLEPCGIFHDDVCYRGKLDLTVVRPDDALIVVDFKSSREPRESFDQLEMAATAALIERPDVSKAYGIYMYTKHKTRQMEPIFQHDIPNMVRKVWPRLERLRDARERAKLPKDNPERREYRPIPGRHCRWCPVVTCPHNTKPSVIGTITQQRG